MENTEKLYELHSTLLEEAYTSSNTREDLVKVMRQVAKELLKLKQEVEYNQWLSFEEAKGE